MYLNWVILVVLISLGSTSSQFSSAFYGATFPSGFASPFHDFGSSSSSSFPRGQDARSNTGPVLFPPSPDSPDNGGVIIGGSGYGFVPPGGKDVVRGRDYPSTFGSSPFAQSFFHL